jgi:plastocyanin
MLNAFLRTSCALLAILFGVVILAACGASPTKTTQNVTPSPQAGIVTIPQDQELFTPFILSVQPGTRVTWQNSDTVPHTIMTTWDHGVFLNPEPFSLNVAAGQKASLTLTQPGIYDYFDNTQARWDTTDHRVAANQGVPNFPLAMEGIIWVQGHIDNVSAVTTNAIPDGKDDFTTDFLAIHQGGTISWHNSDTDDHFISLVPGWSKPINPVDLGAIRVKGTSSVSDGETKDVVFPRTGLYYYYCAAHASVNTSWNRVQANKDASEAPIPMEGFVLVTDS